MNKSAAPLLRPVTVALLLSLAGASASATQFVRPRPLTEYEDIVLAQELDRAMTGWQERAAQCAGSGAEGSAPCLCSHPEEARSAEATYAKILQARPKWKGKILFWRNTENQASRSLVIPAIDQELHTFRTMCRPTPAQ